MGLRRQDCQSSPTRTLHHNIWLPNGKRNLHALPTTQASRFSVHLYAQDLPGFHSCGHILLSMPVLNTHPHPIHILWVVYSSTSRGRANNLHTGAKDCSFFPCTGFSWVLPTQFFPCGSKNGVAPSFTHGMICGFCNVVVVGRVGRPGFTIMNQQHP